MTLEDAVRELLQCLGDDRDCVVPWEQVRRWPEGAVDALQGAGWLQSGDLAETVECPGCEESCSMPVEIFPADDGQGLRAFAACEDRNFGRVKIPPARLQQWRFGRDHLARWVSCSLGLKGRPQKDGASGLFKLGSIQGSKRIGALELDASDSVCVKSSGHSLPLAEIVSVENGQPVINRAAILDMVDLPPMPAPKVKKQRKQPPANVEWLEVGTPEWRSQTARNAANARHEQPGGSRDKQQQIREIWATGKYSSRDRCAEKECAAFDMSYSAARKALRNTPDPKPSS
jgi:hypothetical protein